jgi:hypothetical protein
MAGGFHRGTAPWRDGEFSPCENLSRYPTCNGRRTHRVAMYKCALPLLRLTSAPGFMFAPPLPIPRTDGFRRNPKVHPPMGSGFRFGVPWLPCAAAMRGRSPLALPPDICSPVMLC